MKSLGLDRERSAQASRAGCRRRRTTQLSEQVREVRPTETIICLLAMNVGEPGRLVHPSSEVVSRAVALRKPSAEREHELAPMVQWDTATTTETCFALYPRDPTIQTTLPSPSLPPDSCLRVDSTSRLSKTHRTIRPSTQLEQSTWQSWHTCLSACESVTLRSTCPEKGTWKKGQFGGRDRPRTTAPCSRRKTQCSTRHSPHCSPDSSPRARPT